MKKTFIFLLLVFARFAYSQQIEWIGNEVENTNGSTFFKKQINPGADAFINWEVFATGAGCNTSDGGSQVSSRVVLRKASNTTDPNTVIATAPVYIPGGSSGQKGNNDGFFVNLKDFISTSDVYSVEIEATCGTEGNYRQNSSQTRSTWNFDSPNVSWRMNSADDNGISSVTSTDQRFLQYFVVGQTNDANMYRSMVVFNDMFYDIKKMVPGNPSFQSGNANFTNNIGSVPNNAGEVYNGSVALENAPKLANVFEVDGTPGFCASNPPVLPMGGEVNVWKIGTGDVTGAKVFYSVHKIGEPASFKSFDVNFSDNCSSSEVFNQNAIGGTCFSTNGLTMQRWRTPKGINNVFEGVNFDAVAGAEDWVIEYFTETYFNSGSVSKSTDAVQAMNFKVAASTENECLPFPVVLTHFTATVKDSSICLEWATASETNNKEFVVERATDAIVFEEIGRLSGKDTSHLDQEYLFSDKSPNIGDNYYRLKQIDYNGDSTLSKIVSAKYSQLLNIVLYPNPVDQMLFVRGLPSGSQFQVLDEKGRIKLSGEAEDKDGAATRIDVRKFKAGVYFFSVQQSDSKEYKAFKFFVY